MIQVFNISKEAERLVKLETLICGRAMAEADYVEGFICPLCRQDLQSFQHLDAHFREEHKEESGRSKLKTNLKSFLDKAKSSFTKKPSYVVEDGASAVGVVSGSGTSDAVQLFEPVTNVSGIDPLMWPTQEMGELLV